MAKRSGNQPTETTIELARDVALEAKVAINPVASALDKKHKATIVSLEAKIGTLTAMVNQSLSDLAYLAKTTHSEYAQRREKEVRAALGKI